MRCLYKLYTPGLLTILIRAYLIRLVKYSLDNRSQDYGYNFDKYIEVTCFTRLYIGPPNEDNHLFCLYYMRQGTYLDVIK